MQTAEPRSALTHIKFVVGGRVSALVWFVRVHPIGAVAAFAIFVMVVAAVFAPWVAPADPLRISPAPLEPPSWAHLMGTDNIGRDIFSRVIYGARISLWVGFLAVAISIGAGTLIGLISGYMGGTIDLVLQRVVDLVQAMPPLVMALALVAILEPSATNSIIAIAIVATPGNARVVRSTVLVVKETSYVEAAKVIGCRTPRIMLRHVLPNVTAPIIVLASLGFGYAILIEATLSFLGLGTQPPTPSWGSMLNLSQTFLERSPHLAIFPGLAISVAVLAFNLLGDTLRDILDPKLRGR